MSDFWSEVDKTDQREEGGGGGIICFSEINYGYKVWASDVKQEVSFFSAPPGRSKEAEVVQQAAKAKAVAFTAECLNALEKRRTSGAVSENAYLEEKKTLSRGCRWSLCIKALRDDAVSRGQAVTWQEDRYFVTAVWTPAYKEVVKPSLIAAGLTGIPWQGWCRIGFQPDPYREAQGEAGMTDKDQNGVPRFPQIAYIVEVFPDEEAARAAVSLPEPEEIPLDPGTALPHWDELKELGWKDAAFLRSELQRASGNGKQSPEIAQDLGIPVGIVRELLEVT